MNNSENHKIRNPYIRGKSESRRSIAASHGLCQTGGLYADQNRLREMFQQVGKKLSLPGVSAVDDYDIDFIQNHVFHNLEIFSIEEDQKLGEDRP